MKPTTLVSFLLLSISCAHAAPVHAIERGCSPASGGCQALNNRQFNAGLGGGSGSLDPSSGGGRGSSGDPGFGSSNSDDPAADSSAKTVDTSKGSPVGTSKLGSSDTSTGDLDNSDDATITSNVVATVSVSTPNGTVVATDSVSIVSATPTATDLSSSIADATATATDLSTSIADATAAATDLSTSIVDATATATDSGANVNTITSTAAATASNSVTLAESTAPAATATAPPVKAATAGTCPPAINDATVNLIKQFEGFVPSPDPDPVGLPTVGFGHKCQKPGCSEVPFSFPLSQTTAAQLLQNDVKTFTKCVNDAVSPKVRLNDNQFGALTSFTFNLGCGSLKTSTLLRRLNAGEDPNTVAAQEIPKFNKAGGKVLAGLTRRRNAEVALFKKASSAVAHPCN